MWLPIQSQLDNHAISASYVIAHLTDWLSQFVVDGISPFTTESRRNKVIYPKTLIKGEFYGFTCEFEFSFMFHLNSCNAICNV